MAILVPVFSYAPKIYLWLLRRRILGLYRELRAVEHGLDARLPSWELETYRADLDRIDSASKVLPMRHSDLFFALRTHIELVRARLQIMISGGVT